MGLWTTVGAIGGGALGFIGSGFNPMGAVAGASLGSAIGNGLDGGGPSGQNIAGPMGSAYASPAARSPGQSSIGGHQTDPMGEGRSVSDKRLDELWMRENASNARTAPQMQAAQAKLAQINAARLAYAKQAQDQNIGAANQAQAAQINNAQAEWRQRQLALSDALTAQANGQGPSLAAMQAHDTLSQGLSQQAGLIGAGRGNAGAARHAVAQNAAMMTQQVAGQAAQARLAEQMQARQMLGSQLESARGADIGFASQQAAFDQQAALANQAALNSRQSEQAGMNLQNSQFNANASNANALARAQFEQQARLANMGAQNQQEQFNAGLRQGASQTNLGSQLQMEGMKDAYSEFSQTAQMRQEEADRAAAMGFSTAQTNANIAQEQANAAAQQRSWALIGGGAAATAAIMANSGGGGFGGGGGGGGGLSNNQMAYGGGNTMGLTNPWPPSSDERVKRDVRSGDAEVRRFLDALSAHSYAYKDPNAPGSAPGRHVSPMAQELERTPMGRDLVMTDENGTKRVDYQRGLGAMLAAQASLNARIEDLESALKARTSRKAA